VKQNKLNKGFACASQLGNPPQRPKQLKMTIQQTVSPPGLYPPKHYPKATNTTSTALSPGEQPTSDEFSQIFHKTELKFRPDEIIYTDGSRKEIPGIGLVTGSGVYREHKHAHLSLKVHPYEQGMLNTINRAEVVALLIAVRHCRPGVKESIATDSKCSMQKIGMHLRSPSSTVDDCHRPLLEAIGHEILQRAHAGDETILLKHIGIHGNEMADKLANEAADECCMSRHFDYDLSNDYTQPFKDKFWFQHTIQVQTAGGPAETKACIRDSDDFLRKALHDKHKLGQSKQDSLHFQLWDKVQPFRVKPHSDALWTMPSVPESHKRNIFKYRTGQVRNKNMAFKRRMSYMPGQPIARDTRCPLCRGDDSQGHIFGSRMHPDMSKQYTARHDKATRTVIQAFTKGQCGNHYLIADVGKIEGLKGIGVHSKRVPAFVLPDRCLQASGLDPMVERGFLQGGAVDTRSKMRPDMMIVEMTAGEQQQYLHHDDNSGSRLTPLTPVMPNGNPRSIKIVEGGYCPDTRYEEKLQEKGAPHKALEEALKDYGYNVTTLPIIIGQSGTQYHTTSDVLARIGIEHGPASKVMSKLHEHSVLTLHKILTSRRILEGRSQTKADKTGQIHLRFRIFSLSLRAMAYGHSSGLPP